MKLKIIIYLISILSLLGCGKNIFEGITKVDENMLDQIENASSQKDYNNLITSADNIINSNSATSEEKAEAYLIKAEALLGKSDITPVDIMTELALSADRNINPINVLNTTCPIEDLIAASEALSKASDLGNSGNDEQNLMKGIVNTMIVINTVSKEFTIDEDGTVVNNISDYSESLDAIMHPNPSSDLTILDYSYEALEGFQNSGALTDEQLAETQTISTQAQKIVSINKTNDSSIEMDLKSIFEGF